MFSWWLSVLCFPSCWCFVLSTHHHFPLPFLDAQGANYYTFATITHSDPLVWYLYTQYAALAVAPDFTGHLSWHLCKMQCHVTAHRYNLVTNLGAKLSVAANIYFPASSQIAHGISNTQTCLVGRALWCMWWVSLMSWTVAAWEDRLCVLLQWRFVQKRT